MTADGVTAEQSQPAGPSEASTHASDGAGGGSATKRQRAELHLHLESCLRPSTARELAERHGLPLPTIAPYADFAEFAPQYEAARDLIVDLAALRRAAQELVEDQDARGVVFTEVNMCPGSYAGRLGADEELVETVLSVFPRDRFGLILGMQRAAGPEAGWQVVRLATRYASEGVTGLGLVGPEPQGPAEWYTEHYARAREAGLMCVPHAGETAGAASVAMTLDRLQPDRILHGIRAIEDPAVVARLAEQQVCLDMCVTSNVNLGIASSYQAHPAARMLRAGVPISLSSDCTFHFDTDIEQEYQRARDDVGLSEAELDQIAANSLAWSAKNWQPKG